MRQGLVLFFFPSDPLGVAPEVFQIVIHPRIVVEDVDDHIDIIHSNPSLPFIPRPVKAGESHLCGQLVDLITHAAHLPGTRAGGDDVKVGEGRDAGHVEHDHAMAACALRQPGGFYRELSGCFEALGLGLRRSRRGLRSCFPSYDTPTFLKCISITSAGQNKRMGIEENPSPRLTMSQVPPQRLMPPMNCAGRES